VCHDVEFGRLPAPGSTLRAWSVHKVELGDPASEPAAVGRGACASLRRTARSCFDVRMSSQPLLVLVAGPYRSGTGDDPAKLAANVEVMNRAALEVFRRGHVPVTGEAVALPLIELAGSTRVGDAVFGEIFHPVARGLLDRCDAVLRVGGASAGADEMVTRAAAGGKLVAHAVDELPAIDRVMA
jgi:hypothetical protein